MKLVFLLVLCALNIVDLKPVNKVDPEEVSEEEDDEDMDTGLEYDKYLRQVISVLEKDPEMRKKMESSNMEDLKSGKLALELDQMPGHYRSQLDELKRMEVQRLRMVAKQMMDQQSVPGFIEKLKGKPGSNPKELFENLVGHVDPQRPDKFSEKDLTNLLRKATKDLDAADKKRREEFKNYEMEKEIQRREKLKEMDQQQREAAEKEFQEHKKKVKEHEKLKHPGSKAQLEEVWEETDHLDKDDFNPKTFFALHDTNGDGNLDPFELEALFIKEVEKIYKDSDADPKEKFEELARMREHVLREIDTDKNKLVSLEEFLKATDESEFENDEGWEDLQQEEMFEEEELEGYEKKLKERELKRQKQREEFEARKAKMHMEQENFQKNNEIPKEPIAMDQAAAEKKLTDIQEDEKLKFDAAANAVNEANKQIQQQIVNHEAVRLQQEANKKSGQLIENNDIPQNDVPQQGNNIPQPQAGQPQPGQPQTGQPQAGQSNPGQPQAGQQPPEQPHAGQPQPGQPQGGQPQAGQPQGGQPQAGQPQPGQPQAGQPQAGQPQPGQPQGGQQPPEQPQQGQPQAGKPQPGQPQAQQPQAGQPQAQQPQAGQPQAQQPQAGQPQAQQPQAGQPQAQQPQAGQLQPQAGQPTA